ncbi:MAG: PQQ-binding-like beta-propeller repeat protein [Longimicrobiales bacterium]
MSGHRASLVAVLLIATACSSGGDTDGDWPHYGGDLGASKYSPLGQIHAGNVDQLEVAWEWESADYGLFDGPDDDPDDAVNPNLQTTPIMVGGRLFASTNMSQAAAIDPTTGETLWVHNPWERQGLEPRGRANRGVAHWTSGTPDDAGRIFLVFGEQLTAIDAVTGEAILDFGDQGVIDLADDPDPRVTTYSWTSAPLVVRDVVILGSQRMAPNRNSFVQPPGYVRGYDVRTGELKWRFNPVPQPGDVGYETWEGSSWEYTGDAGAWTLLAGDNEKGLVYLPLKTTTNDWYGGERPGDNLFGESLVCLDAETGELKWYYQMIRHGLWDYDPPAAPILVDIEVDGQPIEAVVQVTKQAFAFVFDRVTGEPVWPIEDRPVPAGDVPGEWYAETQPFPTKPAPFDLQGITKDDLIDFTPELRAEAEEILDQFVYGPMFTPPTVKDESPGGTLGTILMPGWVGGANWNGAAADPETGMLYVPSVTSPNVTALVAPNPDSMDHRYIRGLPREVPMPGGLPLLKPPYGRVTAIDLNTGDDVWMTPNGPGPRDHPALQGLDLPWLGQRGRPAPLLTSTLLFIGEGSTAALSILPIAGGDAFRAYDKATGEPVWETHLEAGTSGAPMTYAVDGRQFIVVAIGDDETRGQFVALAIP